MLKITLSIQTSVDDPESIIRNAIASLARYEASVPAGESVRVIRDDNGNCIGSLNIVNE